MSSVSQEGPRSHPCVADWLPHLQLLLNVLEEFPWNHRPFNAYQCSSNSGNPQISQKYKVDTEIKCFVTISLSGKS